MNKAIIMSLLLITVSLTQISAVSAWNWDTHQEIVESNYYSLPADMQQNLDLGAMKDGSDDPDFKFFDFKYHGYPNSYDKAIYWLNEGQKHYEIGDYYYASYCYGVASHYITDSFAAPHAAGVSGLNHNLYEVKASFLKPEAVQITGDLDSTLYNGDLKGTKSWNIWVKNKDDSLIQNDLNQATGASYNAMYTSLTNAHPTQKNNSNDDAKLSLLMPLLHLI